MMITLSLDDVRALLLAAQGLAAPPARAATKADVLAAIRRMGLLQLDSISVVARSHYLVLWSRLGAYDIAWLDDLLPEGKVFEYWAHAACLLPVEDYHIYRRRMLDYADNGAFIDKLEPKLGTEINRILDHVREHGAVRSAAFKHSMTKRSGWWDWSPPKRALEYLFNAGVLMVARRNGFQRVYDLRERVLPAWDDQDTCSYEEGVRTLSVKAVKALGAAPARWLFSYYPNYIHSRKAKRDAARILNDLTASGVLVEAAVEGWGEPVYIHQDNLELATQANNDRLHSSITTFLSPFDPIVSDRTRAEELFSFSYRIEAYTPADRRQFGYFTLPILHHGALVGRMDAKVQRKTGVFEVKSLHLEAGVPVSDDLAAALAAALRDFAAWHGTPQITLGYCDLPELADALEAG